MPNNKEAAIRKRQQIDSSKRTMFFAVAGAAFVSGMSLVVAFFLLQQIIFHSNIISSKQSTLRIIRENIETVDKLKENVRVLEANEALNTVKIKGDSSALQPILDALPSEPNADALGASLQIKFVGAVEGLKLETLSVDSVDKAMEPIGGPAVSTGTQSNDSSDDASSGGVVTDDTNTDASIGFSMVVSGSADQMKELLVRFERSIRVISIDSIDVEAEPGGLRMTLKGKAFYEPAQQVKLGKKVIKP